MRFFVIELIHKIFIYKLWPIGHYKLESDNAIPHATSAVTNLISG